MKKNTLLIITAILLCSCSDPTSSRKKETFEINIPLNQTVIHANASYLESDGVITLNNLVISSLTFNEALESGDSTYINGTIEQYIHPDFDNSGRETGMVKMSITDEWISLESLSSNLTDKLFLKQSTDTTAKATINFQHLPIYPRSVSESKRTEIIRKENSGDGWQLPTVYREFQAGNKMTWDDNYGRQDGIFVKTLEHTSTTDSLTISAMFDESGIVISQYSLALIFIDNNNPANTDTTYFHQINRRVRNYAEPLLVPQLKTFADKIINTPLHFFVGN